MRRRCRLERAGRCQGAQARAHVVVDVRLVAKLRVGGRVDQHLVARGGRAVRDDLRAQVAVALVEGRQRGACGGARRGLGRARVKASQLKMRAQHNRSHTLRPTLCEHHACREERSPSSATPRRCQAGGCSRQRATNCAPIASGTPDQGGGTGCKPPAGRAPVWYSVAQSTRCANSSKFSEKSRCERSCRWMGTPRPVRIRRLRGRAPAPLAHARGAAAKPGARRACERAVDPRGRTRSRARRRGPGRR